MSHGSRHVLEALTRGGPQSTSQIVRRVSAIIGCEAAGSLTSHVKWILHSLMRVGKVTMTIADGVPRYQCVDADDRQTAPAPCREATGGDSPTMTDLLERVRIREEGKAEWERAKRRVIRLIELEIEMLDLRHIPIYADPVTSGGSPGRQLAQQTLRHFESQDVHDDAEPTKPSPSVIEALLTDGSISETVAVDVAGPLGPRRTMALRKISLAIARGRDGGRG